MTVPPSYKKRRTGVAFRDESDGTSAFFVNLDEDQVSDRGIVSGLVRRGGSVPDSVRRDPQRGVFSGFASAADSVPFSSAPIFRDATQASGMGGLSPTGTLTGDLVICAVWETSGAPIPTHTLQTGFTEIVSYPHVDGSTNGRMSIAYMTAPSGGAAPYTPYSSGGSGAKRNITVSIQSGTFDVTGFKSGTVTDTTNAAPNPAAISGLTGNWLVLVFGGWHFGSTVLNDVTPPTGYDEYEDGPSSTTDFVCAGKTLTGVSNATEDPGAFADTQSPNGTSCITLGVKGIG